MAFRSLLLALAVLGTPVLAEQVTIKVVQQGREMKPIAGWPEGTMKVINHPFRTGGWHSEFSKCQNDRYYFALDIDGPADLHRLVKTFAAIQNDELLISINPEDGGHHVEGAPVVFALGNQPIIDAWFKRLAVGKDGARKFGVHTFHEPPKAQPPSLFLYAGHRGIELAKLRIPKNITFPVNRIVLTFFGARSSGKVHCFNYCLVSGV